MGGFCARANVQAAAADGFPDWSRTDAASQSGVHKSISDHANRATEQASNAPSQFQDRLQSSTVESGGIVTDPPGRYRCPPPPENGRILQQESADRAPYTAIPGGLHGKAMLDLVRNADVNQFVLMEKDPGLAASNWDPGNVSRASSVEDGSSQQQNDTMRNRELPTTVPTFMQKVPFQAASPEFALSRYGQRRQKCECVVRH